MNISVNIANDGQKAKLSVSGSLTVQYASNLLDTLRDIAAANQNLDVEVGEVDSVDMTFFQLMCSAHRTFSAADKHFLLKQGKNNLLKKGAASGFLRHKGCSRDKFGTCAMVMEQ